MTGDHSDGIQFAYILGDALVLATSQM